MYRLSQLAANYKARAPGPPTETVGAPWATEAKSIYEVRTYLLNQPIVSAQACVAASGL